MKEIKKIKEASKKPLNDFSKRIKRPIFILGVTFWIGLLLFFGLSSMASFRTANAINNQEILGLSGYFIFLILFLVLGVLLFFVWKKMIKRK